MMIRIYMKCFKTVVRLLPFRWPRCFEGEGSAEILVDEVIASGYQRIFIVSDRTLQGLGMLEPVIQRLEQAKCKVVLYTAILPDPTTTEVSNGAQLYSEHQCEAVIALGGGSVIDAAKLIGAEAMNGKQARRMTGLFKVWRGMPPLFAVPTTAGTGSETTIAAVVRDTLENRKYAVMDLKLMPTATALDPTLMYGLPAKVTATTGMDALTHAVEAYLSRNALKRTDALALEAVTLISQNLRTAFKKGLDKNARLAMARASHLAGRAFTQAGVGYVHAISHTLGARYGIAHGLANAIVMPYVLEFSLPKCQHRMANLARAAQLANGDEIDSVLARRFIAYVRELNNHFSIPVAVKQLQANDIAEIARTARAEARFTYAVPRRLTQTQAEQLLQRLLKKA